jgi:UDP-N-acetyl-D-mannosaminuronate dehydrogenase
VMQPCQQVGGECAAADHFIITWGAGRHGCQVKIVITRC